MTRYYIAIALCFIVACGAKAQTFTGQDYLESSPEDRYQFLMGVFEGSLIVWSEMPEGERPPALVAYMNKYFLQVYDSSLDPLQNRNNYALFIYYMDKYMTTYFAMHPDSLVLSASVAYRACVDLAALSMKQEGKP